MFNLPPNIGISNSLGRLQLNMLFFKSKIPRCWTQEKKKNCGAVVVYEHQPLLSIRFQRLPQWLWWWSSMLPIFAPVLQMVTDFECFTWVIVIAQSSFCFPKRIIINIILEFPPPPGLKCVYDDPTDSFGHVVVGLSLALVYYFCAVSKARDYNKLMQTNGILNTNVVLWL